MRKHLIALLLYIITLSAFSQYCYPIDSMLLGEWKVDSMFTSSEPFHFIPKVTNTFSPKCLTFTKTKAFEADLDLKGNRYIIDSFDYHLTYDSCFEYNVLEFNNLGPHFAGHSKLRIGELNPWQLELIMDIEHYSSPLLSSTMHVISLTKTNVIKKYDKSRFSGKWALNKPPCEVKIGDTLVFTKNKTQENFNHLQHPCINKDSNTESLSSYISLDTFNFNISMIDFPEHYNDLGSWGQFTEDIDSTRNLKLDYENPIYTFISVSSISSEWCINELNKTCSFYFREGWQTFEYYFKGNKIDLIRIE